jgi:hypothetical protein
MIAHENDDRGHDDDRKRGDEEEYVGSKDAVHALSVANLLGCACVLLPFLFAFRDRSGGLGEMLFAQADAQRSDLKIFILGHDLKAPFD